MYQQKNKDNNGVKYVGGTLEKLFSSLRESYSETLGRKYSSPSSEDHIFDLFTSSIFSPGTLNCLCADKDIIYPTLLLFINKYAKGYRKEIGIKSSLLVSSVPSDDFVFRIIAYNLRIGINRLRKGHLIGQDWPKITRIAGLIHDSNMYFLNEEPQCLRNVVGFQNDAFKDTKRLKNVFSSASDRIPLGLIIIHDDESLTDERQNSPEFMSRLEELRSIAMDFQLSIIISHNIQNKEPLSLPPALVHHFDFQMKLQSEMNRYTLSIAHEENGLVGTIPLVMFPEIGVMED
jgi:hypothetical protein